MSDRLGGALARKPLHFIFVLDVSGSMLRGGRIQALNNAISEVLPHLKDEARANPHAELLVRVLAFANEPRWVIQQPTPVDQVHWERLEAVPRGFTELGSALLTLTDALDGLDESSSAYPPAIILVSDGRPTQSSGTTFAEGLQALLNNRWGRHRRAARPRRGPRRRHALPSPVHRRRGDPAAAGRQPRAARRVHRVGVEGRQQGGLATRGRRRADRRSPEPDR
ncbi:VWA domain-containing protein [Nocardioides sp. TF02-7]|uniref:vWA domain-containing protein n=1 Tax=Nocardioides sp. TF02-7 TaxID=2917724 RepID=UPI001F05A4F8|nr:VWA domain-containing protein [Nocardioides sp. TF02-7]UMG91785.1 VWA domain-containing protein [Nocardioides sp. TF02-7]